MERLPAPFFCSLYIFSFSLISVAVLSRCAAQMLFDVFSEKTTVGESRLVADFLDAQIGVVQAVSNVSQSVFLYPVISSLSGVFFANYGEVLGGDAQFSGIIIHRLMLDRIILKKL